MDPINDINNIPIIQNNNIQNSNPNIPYINIGGNSFRYISNIGVYKPSIREVKVDDTASYSVVPREPPVVVHIGKPIVNMPGCVQLHKENVKTRNRNRQLVDNDPKGNVVLCDAGAPNFIPPDYQANRLTWETIYGQAPEVDSGVDVGDPPPPPGTPDSPEPPSTPSDTKEDPPCPGPLAPRIGDVALNQKEKLSGFELQRILRTLMV